MRVHTAHTRQNKASFRPLRPLLFLRPLLSLNHHITNLSTLASRALGRMTIILTPHMTPRVLHLRQAGRRVISSKMMAQSLTKTPAIFHYWRGMDLDLGEVCLVVTENLRPNRMKRITTSTTAAYPSVCHAGSKQPRKFSQYLKFQPRAWLRSSVYFPRGPVYPPSLFAYCQPYTHFPSCSYLCWLPTNELHRRHTMKTV